MSIIKKVLLILSIISISYLLFSCNIIDELNNTEESKLEKSEVEETEVEDGEIDDTEDGTAEEEDPQNIIFNPSDINVSGNFIYSYEQDTVKIIDITDKTSPILAGSYKEDIIKDGVRVFYITDYFFVVNQGGLSIYDIADFDNIALIKTISISGIVDDLFIEGDYLYISTQKAGLLIYDITDVPNIILKSSFPVTDSTDAKEDGNHVYVKNNLAYVTKGDEGLKIIDVTDKANPTLTGSIDPPTGYGVFAQDVFVTNSHIYIAYGGGGMTRYDIATKNSAGSYNVDASEIVATDTYVIIEDYGNGIVILDNDLALLSKISEGESSSLFSLVDESLYIAKGGKLAIYNISNAETPVIVFESL